MADKGAKSITPMSDDLTVMSDSELAQELRLRVGEVNTIREVMRKRRIKSTLSITTQDSIIIQDLVKLL